MSHRNRVVWTEGLFLRPQLFQQQDRHWDYRLHRLAQVTHPHPWGFFDIAIDRDQLAIGKLAVSSAHGLFQDGTSFAFPDHDAAPSMRDLTGTTVHDKVVYLAMPSYQPGGHEVALDANQTAEMTRYHAHEVQLRDTATPGLEAASVDVARVSLRIVMEGDVLDNLHCVPLARVVEVQSSGQVILDDQFIPTSVHVNASNRLRSLVDELIAIVETNAESAASSVATRTSDPQVVQQLLRLTALNRVLPGLRLLREHPQCHPWELFGLMAALYGDLASYSPPRQVKPLSYSHDNLDLSFRRVMNELKSLLVNTRLPGPTSIPVTKFGETPDGGAFGGRLNDKTLLGNTIVLAAKADLPESALVDLLPKQISVATESEIKDVLSGIEDGMRLRPLAQAPASIPLHAGYVYFEIEHDERWWARLQNSAGFAIHVQSSIPNVELQMWSVKEILQ